MGTPGADITVSGRMSSAEMIPAAGVASSSRRQWDKSSATRPTAARRIAVAHRHHRPELHQAPGREAAHRPAADDPAGPAADPRGHPIQEHGKPLPRGPVVVHHHTAPAVDGDELEIVGQHHDVRAAGIGLGKAGDIGPAGDPRLQADMPRDGADHLPEPRNGPCAHGDGHHGHALRRQPGGLGLRHPDGAQGHTPQIHAGTHPEGVVEAGDPAPGFPEVGFVQTGHGRPSSRGSGGAGSA